MLSRRDVAKRAHEAAVVKLLDPFEGRKLEVLDAPPWAAPAHLRHVEADHCF